MIIIIIIMIIIIMMIITMIMIIVIIIISSSNKWCTEHIFINGYFVIRNLSVCLSIRTEPYKQHSQIIYKYMTPI